MCGNVIAICDSERSYAERLMEYLRQKLASNYEIEMYTSAEKMLDLCDPEKIILAVVAEKEYGTDVEKAGFAQVLVLNETGNYLGSDVVNYSKYQSMETLIAVIRQMCVMEEQSTPGAIRHAGPMHIIGVYTPISRCLQTTFSMTMGQILARKGKVLYLNFENYSGLDIMLGRTFRGTVADLIFYNDVAREKLSGQLQSLAENLGSMDFIPPMKSFVELRSIRGSQWLELFQSIEQVTDYEYLILDLSEQTDSLFTILRECEQIFTIERDDAISTAKMTGYENLLRAGGCEDIATKTKRWKFPVFKELPANMENLTHGEMAECVRRLLLEAGYGI